MENTKKMEHIMALYMMAIQSFQFLILGYFISAFYQKKNPGKLNGVYVFSVVMIVARMIYVYLLLPEISEQFYTPYMMVIMGISLYYCYEMSVLQDVGMIVAYVGICAVPTCLTVFCMQRIPYLPENILCEGGYSPEIVITLSIMDMIINLVYVAILVIYYILKKSLQLPGRLLFLMIFLYQVLIFGIYVEKCKTYHPILLITGICMVILTTLVDIVLIEVMGTLIEQGEMEATVSSIYEQRACELQYYQVLDEEKEKMKEVQQFFFGKLKEMYLAAGKREGAEQLIGWMNETNHRLSKSRVRQYCENQTINSVIHVKKKKADALGIQMDINIKLPERTEVEAMDMCSIFCNLLDNAIEACKKVSGERYIRLTAEAHAGYFMILETNSMEGELQRKNGKILSSKGEKKLHGYGLGLITTLSRKYGGNVEIRESEGMFSICVTLNEDFLLLFTQ